MDFNDTPAEAAFRAEVRAWLKVAAADYARPPAKPWTDDDYVQHARRWMKIKTEGGYGAILWPVSAGGRGGTSIEQVIYEEEEGHYYVPIGPFVNIGMRNSVPTIVHHGTPEQIEAFTGPTMRGEMAWVQLFSEPGAGSDLANLRTRAVRNGDNWVVNGQKVWSSWAHYADFGILLVRTDPTLAKHKGITFFILDMKTPGIEVRPIRQISGKADFNEVFLTDVVIPDSARLGPLNGGWGVAMTTLTGERLGGAAGATGLNADVVFARAVETGAIESAATREKIARWKAQELAQRNFRYRLLTKVSKGEPLGALAALDKAVSYKKLQDMAAYAMDLEGYAGLFDDEADPV
ncbi:MAG: hypothetical protein JWR59_796, partial [Brevundimonas sp.]|nr:hypothetical protein [Brevundimonas sp.]